MAPNRPRHAASNASRPSAGTTMTSRPRGLRTDAAVRSQGPSRPPSRTWAEARVDFGEADVRPGLWKGGLAITASALARANPAAARGDPGAGVSTPPAAPRPAHA